MRMRLVIPGIILVALLIGSQAMAAEIYFDDFDGLPEGTVSQQDKLYYDFEDVFGNFVDMVGAKTTIKTSPFDGYDVHTVQFTGVFEENQKYGISYVMQVDPEALASIVISKVGIGFDHSFGSKVSGTLQKTVWAYDPIEGTIGAQLFDMTVKANAGDFGIGNQKAIFVKDIITVNNSTVNSASNSFIETGLPSEVPEPATLSLLGLGIVGLGFVARRRDNSK